MAKASATAVDCRENGFAHVFLLRKSDSIHNAFSRFRAMKGSSTTFASIFIRGSSENPPQATCTFVPAGIPRSSLASEIMRRSVGL